jgi:hypothetical protein
MLENSGRFKNTRQSLLWSPLCHALESQIRGGDPPLLLISPFIGLDALKKLLADTNQQQHCRAKVLVRWRPEDLLNGVSDIAIYPYLSELGISLYMNHDIHLKLYIFESNTALATSGNLTLRGLGYCEDSNIEVGSFVELDHEDWTRLYELIGSSREVDDYIYEQYKRYLEQCPDLSGPLPSAPILNDRKKEYTISSLPAMESPRQLIEYYSAPETFAHAPEIVRRAAHDIVEFAVPHNLSPSELELQLRDSFRHTRFVVEFIKVLKSAQSLRFGAVNDWIHQKCDDVPLPYRWEIKENTRIFYNWLQHFFPEITWDRPNYSQVIYWQGR